MKEGFTTGGGDAACFGWIGQRLLAVLDRHVETGWIPTGLSGTIS